MLSGPCALVDARSLIRLPCALAFNMPPACVVAPVKSRLPALAATVRLPFVDVWLPERLALAPCTDALPPAAFVPLADTEFTAPSIRSPLCAIEPSALTPAPNRPVEAIVLPLTVVFCCAARLPLLAIVPPELTVTDCAAYVVPLLVMPS